jgi:DNA-binding MarR family transcriptional regulator
MALQRLDPERPGPMHELAGAMGCDPSYVTGIADQLEALGLAERRSAMHDRRVKVLALTSAGVAARQRFLDHLACGPFAVDQLSAAEAAVLAELLERVLDDSEPGSAHHCDRVSAGRHAPGESGPKR